jgi:hypothetical protein
MRPGAITVMSCGATTGSEPARPRISGTFERTSGLMCTTMKSEPGKSAGSAPTSAVSASMAPAEAPIATMS